MILRRSDTLAGLRTAPETILWERHARGPMSCHVWAPELHWLDGAWYLYFAAGDIDDVWNIRPYALRCEGGDPLTGTWREEGLPRRADDFSFNDFSLDLTTFEHGGRRYGVWAGKVNLGKKISNLYIAEMDSPLSFKTPQVLLSAPSYDWERHDFRVNEGPFFLPGKDHVYISFSASATGACYCIGLLCAPAGADLLDPNAWRKLRQPALRTGERVGLYGPGHNSFFRDDAGNTLMAYHARRYDEITGDPLYDPNRRCYLMKVTWQDDAPASPTKTTCASSERRAAGAGAKPGPRNLHARVRSPAAAGKARGEPAAGLGAPRLTTSTGGCLRKEAAPSACRKSPAPPIAAYGSTSTLVRQGRCVHSQYALTVYSSSVRQSTRTHPSEARWPSWALWSEKSAMPSARS